MAISPSSVLELKSSRLLVPRVQNICLDLEYSVARSSKIFRKGLESDTAITMGTTEFLVQSWRQAFTRIVAVIAGERFDYFLDTQRSASQHWKEHYRQLNNIVGVFLSSSRAETGCIVGHTASWNASSVWNLKMGGEVTSRFYAQHFMAESNWRQPSYIRFRGRKSFGGPPLPVNPAQLRWKRPFGALGGLVVTTKMHQTRFPGQAVASRGFSQSLSYGIRNIGVHGPFVDALSFVECPLFRRSTTGEIVLGGMYGSSLTNAASTDESFEPMPGKSVKDVIAIKIGRFLPLPRLEDRKSPKVEYLILSFDPISFEIVSIGSNCSSVHDIEGMDFRTETHMGKWLEANRR